MKFNFRKNTLSIIVIIVFLAGCVFSVHAQDDVMWFTRLDLAFGIDSSGSMDWNDPDDIRMKGSKLLTKKELSSGDQAGVVSWDYAIDFSFPLTKDLEAVRSKLDEINSSGGTNLNIGLEESIDIIDQGKRTDASQAVVFLTDGQGNYTLAEEGGPAAEAAQKGYKVFAIGLGEEYEARTTPLKDIAEATGGDWFIAEEPEDLLKIFEKIEKPEKVPQPEPKEPTTTEEVVSEMPVETHKGVGIPERDIEAGFAIGENLLFLRRGVGSKGVEELKKKYELKTLRKVPVLGYYRVGLQSTSIKDTVKTRKKLQKDPRVDKAFLDWVIGSLGLNDPQVGKQDHLSVLNVPKRAKKLFPSQGARAKVAVIDSGIDPSLIKGDNAEVIAVPGNYSKGIELSPAVEKPRAEAVDKIGHGTEVATIASAQADNQKFGAGTALKSEVLPIKVLTKEGKTLMHHVGIAMLFATKLKADVANMSIGCNFCMRPMVMKQREIIKTLLERLEEAYFEGRLEHPPPIWVAAAGNDGSRFVVAPAGTEGVISAGSYNLKKNKKSRFSNYGPELDFVAPGENVMTTKLGAKFGGTGQGTSYATPQVTGLIAMMISARSELKKLGTEGIRDIIAEYFTKDVGKEGWDKETGYGLITLPSPEKSPWMLWNEKASSTDQKEE